MNSKTLIYVNYQREIPPFLQNEIKVADGLFDTIFYISPKLYNDNRSDVKSKKVRYVIGTKVDEFISFLLLPFLFFTRWSFQNLKKGLKLKKLSFGFLKTHLIYLYEQRTLIHLLKKAKKNCSNGIIIASWFNACALAVGVFCKKNKSFIPYSFAHAFEVKPDVSKYLGATFDQTKIALLNKVYFISNNVKETYTSYLKENGILFDEKKIDLRYLGVFDNGVCPFDSSEEYKTIVSCSSVVDVKRLDLIPSVLNLCNTKIKWVHIGDGPLFDSLKGDTSRILSNKNNIYVDFLGHLTNEEVINYYRNNSIDLFINVSKSEGLPVSIMEAISFGIPVIATKVGGTNEIVNDKNGLLLDADFELERAAKTIDSFFECSNEKVLERRKEARAKWLKDFNITTIADKFYNNL